MAYLWRFDELLVYKCALRGDQPIAFAVKRALASCIMVEQILAYEREFASLEKHGIIPSNSTLRLKPFVGDDGRLRASYRIDRGDFPEDLRRPIILPLDSCLTRRLSHFRCTPLSGQCFVSHFCLSEGAIAPKGPCVFSLSIRGSPYVPHGFIGSRNFLIVQPANP